MPLNIFEPRYKKMIDHARLNDSIIGMVQPTASNTSNKRENNDLYGTAPRGRELYKTGCAGLISEFVQTNTGDYFIILTGLKRFKIIDEAPMVHDFREMNVSYNDFNIDGNDELQKNIKLIPHFLKSLESYFHKLQIKIDLKAFEDVSNEELINSMAMICPFDAAEKQLLIEQPLLDKRCELMLQIIDFNIRKHAISSKNNIH